MAFLNFIFKDKQHEGEAPREEEASSPAAESAASTDAPEEPEPSPAAGEQDAPVPSDSQAEKEPAMEHLGEAEAMDLDQLVEALQLISEYLDDEEEEEASTENPENAVSIPFTLEQVSDLLTEAFDPKAVATADTTKMVHIVIEDVYEQLGKGKITAPVRRVLAEVPPDLLARGFDRFSKDAVSLPLALVVAAVQPTELESRAASHDQAVDVDSLPDLFSAPREPEAGAEGRDGASPDAKEEASSPGLMSDPFSLASSPAKAAPSSADAGSETQEEEAGGSGVFAFNLNDDTDIFNFSPASVKESDEAEAGVAEAQPDGPAEEPAPAEASFFSPAAAVDEPAEAPVPFEPTLDEDEQEAAAVDDKGETEGDAVDVSDEEAGDDLPLMPDSRDVRLAGLDLNAATAEEMSDRLDGVGPRLAARIVRHREVNGPFRSTADLARVQGVGPSTYRKMTGQSWSEARDSLKRTLDYVLGAENNEMPDLKALARRIRSLSGFEGCVFAHSDGQMLAASWEHEKLETLGAVAPQMLKKLLPYVDELDIGDLSPLTLCLGDTSICIAQSGHVIMATVHRATGLGRRQIRLIELVGAELEQRLDSSLRL